MIFMEVLECTWWSWWILTDFEELFELLTNLQSKFWIRYESIPSVSLFVGSRLWCIEHSKNEQKGRMRDGHPPVLIWIHAHLVGLRIVSTFQSDDLALNISNFACPFVPNIKTYILKPVEICRHWSTSKNEKSRGFCPMPYTSGSGEPWKSLHRLGRLTVRMRQGQGELLCLKILGDGINYSWLGYHGNSPYIII